MPPIIMKKGSVEIPNLAPGSVVLTRIANNAVTTPPVVPELSTQELATVKANTSAESQSLDPQLLTECDGLMITNVEEYHVADNLLTRIRDYNRSVAKLVEDRLDVIIKPIRAGLDLLYAEKRALLQPGEGAEKELRRRMGVYQTEQRKISAAMVEQERQAAIARARDAQRLQEEAAATQSEEKARELQAEAENARVEARQQLAASKELAKSSVVQGAGSNSRNKKKARVRRLVDAETGEEEVSHESLKCFLQGMVAGTVPLGVIDLEALEKSLAKFFAADRGMVASWPGVEVWEDVTVVGKRTGR